LCWIKLHEDAYRASVLCLKRGELLEQTFIQRPSFFFRKKRMRWFKCYNVFCEFFLVRVGKIGEIREDEERRSARLFKTLFHGSIEQVRAHERDATMANASRILFCDNETRGRDVRSEDARARKMFFYAHGDGTAASADVPEKRRGERLPIGNPPLVISIPWK